MESSTLARAVRKQSRYSGLSVRWCQRKTGNTEGIPVHSCCGNCFLSILPKELLTCCLNLALLPLLYLPPLPHL